MSIQVGIDIGGTFTDFVVFESDSGNLYFFKLPSSKPPEVAVLDGLRQLGERLGYQLSDVKRVVHGSTVATNALLEKTWAQTALITTAGFRDVLEIGRQQRDSLYDFNVERAEPMVPRERRYEVSERVDASGNVLIPLDENSVQEIAPELKAAEAVAVSLLFSYLNPDHERRIKAILEKELDVPVICSSDVLPEYREFERTSTTVINAALKPIVGAYIGRLSDEMKILGVTGSLEIMQSNGGLVDASIAQDHSENLLFSGPAGGVAATQYFAELTDHKNLIAFDMGGTSCDVSLIENGRALQRVDSKLAGYEVRVPMVDIHSVGAGGGSIAWIDSGGALRVGPQSAGSVPGPACYGSGEEPTVTDAQLILGRFDAAQTLGSRTLDPIRAEKAISEKIADQLGIPLHEAAHGILEIADAHMERAIRVISVERGHDPRDYALLAFGGGGPLHGCSVADRLGICTVVVPSTAGVLSALGMLLADVRRDRVQTILKLTRNSEISELHKLYESMEHQLTEELKIIDQDTILFRREIELRYHGQAYEILIEVEDAIKFDELETAFHKKHKSLFGYSLTEHPTEMVSLRIEAISRSEAVNLPVLKNRTGQLVQSGSRPVNFDRGVELESAIYDRTALLNGDKISGPAVIEGSDSTVLLHPGWSGEVDQHGTLVLTK